LEIFGTFWVVTHLKDSDGTNWFGFFTVFDISGVGVFTMSINTVLVAMIFPRRLGVAVFPPALEALLEGGHRQLKDLQHELEQLRLQLSAAPPVPAMPGRAPSTPAEARQKFMGTKGRK